jgi:hypothetical protein
LWRFVRRFFCRFSTLKTDQKKNAFYCHFYRRFFFRVIIILSYFCKSTPKSDQKRRLFFRILNGAFTLKKEKKKKHLTIILYRSTNRKMKGLASFIYLQEYRLKPAFLKFLVLFKNKTKKKQKKKKEANKKRRYSSLINGDSFLARIKRVVCYLF